MGPYDRHLSFLPVQVVTPTAHGLRIGIPMDRRREARVACWSQAFWLPHGPRPGAQGKHSARLFGYEEVLLRPLVRAAVENQLRVASGDCSQKQVVPFGGHPSWPADPRDKHDLGG